MSVKNKDRCMVANDWEKHRGELPRWFSGVCRRYLQRARNTDDYFSNAFAVNFVLQDNRWNQLFDHFGFIGSGSQSILYTQPYLSDFVLAAHFADALGIELISRPDERGAHHENTYLYQFMLKATPLE
jgi:hypothetical protein